MTSASARDAAVATERPLSVDEAKAFKKVAVRVLPILIVAYVLNYIDRTNVAVAALTMNKDIGLSAAEFGYGAGILFVGYCVFEIPSNLVLYRVGARRWIARIMISWGLVSAAMALVVGVKSFYLVRFLLGVAEAGFFPGVAFYLSSWFPAVYRARIIGWFLVAIPASSLIGAPLSGLFLKLDGLAGLAGWQWLFLLESLPCVAIGFIIVRWLADSPVEARWLTQDERAAVQARLAAERRVQPITTLRGIFTDPRVWVASGIYFGFSIGSYGTQVWLPLMIKQQKLTDFHVALLTGLPYLFAVAAMIIWAAAVDRYGRRVDNVAVTCLLAAAGFALAVVSGSFVVAMVGLTIALIGVNSARAVFWAIPPRFLTGIAAAGGLALINSLGTLGGFVGPSVVGLLRDKTGSFEAGLMAMTGFLLLATVLAIALRGLVRGD